MLSKLETLSLAGRGFLCGLYDLGVTDFTEDTTCSSDEDIVAPMYLKKY